MRIKTLVTAARRTAAALLRAARRFGSAIAEMDRQQRRLFTIHQSTDRYLPNSYAPPETYREFLARTRGALLHEPSARARLAGHAIR
jgi:hypothetical protein